MLFRLTEDASEVVGERKNEITEGEKRANTKTAVTRKWIKMKSQYFKQDKYNNMKLLTELDTYNLIMMNYEIYILHLLK